jgi:hypothetical protein
MSAVALWAVLSLVFAAGFTLGAILSRAVDE